MVNDVDIVGSDDLSAVGPICFVTVVFFRVVGSSDVHATLASEMADCEREFGSGAEIIEKIYFDAVGGENIGNDFCEFARIVAHVVAYCNGDLGQICECLLEIVGETLCSGTYSVDVHAV